MSKVTKKKNKEQCEYEVEEILGFRWNNSEIQFFVKWKGWEDKDNTWSKYEDLTNSVVFREYLNGYFNSLEDEISIKSWKIRHNMREEIEDAFNQAKVLTMDEILPFDPQELKVYQVFFHLLPADPKIQEKLENLTFRSIFYFLDHLQQRIINELLDKIKGSGACNVTIENDEDFSFPPNFQVINKNIIQESTELKNTEENTEPVVGCKCTNCSQFTFCCPQKSKLKFPYKIDTLGRQILRLEKSKEIIECGDWCSCGKDCLNRLTQQANPVPSCLFRTRNRGWGLKVMETIPKGKFITEFVGELISTEEAEARGRTTYTFDINSGSDDYATIDATSFGNLSRFINHSCEPNTGTLVVGDCRNQAKNQRLCFFSERCIRKGEELTINYVGDGQHPKEKITECKCGSDACKGFIL